MEPRPVTVKALPWIVNIELSIKEPFTLTAFLTCIPWKVVDVGVGPAHFGSDGETLKQNRMQKVKVWSWTALSRAQVWRVFEEGNEV